MKQNQQHRLSSLARLWPEQANVEVMDVGANPIEGKAPYAALLAAGLAKVTGFEPQPEPLARLNKVKSQAETYHPVALGDGQAGRLHLFKHSGFSSLFPINSAASRLIGFDGFTHETGQIPVETTRLDDLAEVGRVDYLKIDVQGAETAIIVNGREKLAEAVLIQTEVRFLPLYDGEPGFGALHSLLESMGFYLHDFDFVKRAALRSRSFSIARPWKMRQIVDGDAYYIRNLTQIDTWQDAQIYRLALLAEGVIDNPNLVVLCIDTLITRGRLPQGAVDAYIAQRRSLSAWVRFARRFTTQWKV